MTDTHSTNRYRFIPYRKQDLLEMILQDKRMPEQAADFRQLYYMLGSVFHFEFHQVIESLKDAFAPVDPDSDTRALAMAEAVSGVSFVQLLGGLLEKANYERISEADLNQALTESSLFKIRLHVAFDEFSEVLLFFRGESVREETVSRWLGLFKKTIRFTNYDRVVVYITFKDDFVPTPNHLPNCKPGSTLLKLFQNVPKADLEMLFPNTSIRMRTLDKLLIGIPAVVSGGIVLTTKLGATLVLLGSLFGFWLGMSNQPVALNKATLLVLLAGIGTLGAYLWKQFTNFKNRKLQFMQALTQNLYFKNLDNNAGVFYRLANDAEEEESKEAILAYYFLLMAEAPLARDELDKAIEHWMLTEWQCNIDFEINDAMNKLQVLGLVTEQAGKFTALPVKESILALDKRWDDYFIPDKH